MHLWRIKVDRTSNEAVMQKHDILQWNMPAKKTQNQKMNNQIEHMKIYTFKYTRTQHKLNAQVYFVFSFWHIIS
jgi:hypothetical protein